MNRSDDNLSKTKNIISNQQKYDFEGLRDNLYAKKFYLVFKRTFDISVSFVALVLLSPILILVSILIKLSSPGKVMFKQRRIALDSKEFVMYKFRSMNNNAYLNGYKKVIIDGEKNGVLFKSEKDPRITWIGNIIRRTSIDELPQLINVFKGDMSIIGPRPLIPFMLAPYKEEKACRSLVKPGITGLWQIRDRKNNTSVLGMIKHDLEYIETCSIKTDVKIILNTIPVVLNYKGTV